MQPIRPAKCVKRLITFCRKALPQKPHSAFSPPQPPQKAIFVTTAWAESPFREIEKITLFNTNYFSLIFSLSAFATHNADAHGAQRRSLLATVTTQRNLTRTASAARSPLKNRTLPRTAQSPMRGNAYSSYYIKMLLSCCSVDNADFHHSACFGIEFHERRRLLGREKLRIKPKLHAELSHVESFFSHFLALIG